MRGPQGLASKSGRNVSVICPALKKLVLNSAAAMERKLAIGDESAESPMLPALWIRMSRWWKVDLM